MEFLIVTGRSGAGKSKAMEMLEDMDFVCIDNMPPKLLPSFGQISLKSETDFKTAVVVDVRAGSGFHTLFQALEELEHMGVDYHILFIDCDDETLLRRYKETRRRHPLSRDATIEEAIANERDILAPLKDKADFIIDTTHMKPAQLKERIASIFAGNVQKTMRVQCMSFGFKYGIPADADLVYDVRCLPNPFYLPELKTKTGLDAPVRDYVMSFESSQIMLDKLIDLLDFSLPLYAKEGKSELVVAFGCTGGKHRSVTFAEAMKDHLKQEEIPVSAVHRDIQK